MSKVPTLDLSRWKTDKKKFTEEVGDAYREFGFCCFVNHGVPEDVISKGFAAFKAFFDLPVENKMAYWVEGQAGMRGYTPFKKETAKTSTYPDLKEFWHVGREVAHEDNPYPGILLDNLWPYNDVPQFKAHTLAVYEALEEAGRKVLRPMALDLGLPEEFFLPLTRWGNAILRGLHYPPINPKDLPAIRAEAHEDISFITLLPAATDTGLQLLTKQGDWLPVETDAKAIIVNVGDMMQRMTNHKYVSTTHRVINPEGEAGKRSRYSMPFFLDPNPDASVDPLSICVSAENPSRYTKSMTADEYLHERLSEIKLK